LTTVAELDAMSESEAAEALRACCGSSRWVDGMTARRPFRSRDALFKAADEEWSRTNENDWLEAFSHHPRIGDRSTKGWAAGEQQGAQNATVTIQDELARVNREYEDKFGHIYIVCATGKTADEMLAIAKSRMYNDRESELKAAAEEQRKIMQIRLEKLTGERS
jgi:2-oxo-4-hydroxy-4-carboxy-5-ureidoimidazoline decarboxylase